MKLYADVTRLLRRHLRAIRHSGIDRVSLEYGRWIAERGGHLCVHRAGSLRRLTAKAWNRVLLGELQPGEENAKSQHRALLLLRSLIARKPVQKDSTILVSTHSWLGQDAVWQWLADRCCRAIVFIHDLIPIHFPEYSAPAEKWLHQRRIRNTLQYASGIIVNSDCTGGALRDFACSEGLACPPILINPLGYDLPAPDTNLLPARLRDPYFVLLGTIEPRKNHLLVLMLWREMARRLGEQTPKLVVVGRRGWECEQVVDMLERCDLIHPHLIELNDAPDSQVAALICGARALILPSFAEGFGMPIQEALAFGTPVITSPLPAILEFARDIPDYAEPHDGARWLELLMDYTQPASAKRAAQLLRIPRFKETSWAMHFARLQEFLDGLR